MGQLEHATVGHPEQPKAYSYRRFSTPEQAQGDSLRRQMAAAEEYAARHGLTLDRELTFQDEGVSAYHGRNAEVGALGTFLEAVKHGVVPQGSYLLVESLDRVSRQTVRRAVRTLEDIVEAGVNVVDLSDGGKVYNVETLDNDGMAFLMMTIRFMRAHEESATKARRLLAAYENKRSKLRNPKGGHLFTRRLPAWLRWNERARVIEEIPERAVIVRDIFEKAASGWGKHKIPRWLNGRKVDTWGDGKRKAALWHRTYVSKILSNAAVVGTFTPHRALKDATGARKRKPLDRIEGYFPVIVDREIFDCVAARMLGAASRGRHANREPKSIFAGLMRCEHCASTVTRVTKGKHVYLVCTRANSKADGCQYVAVPYGNAEVALRDRADGIIQDAPRGKDTAQLELEIEQHELKVDVLLDQARELVDELLETKSDVIRRRLRDKETELEEASDAVRSLRARRDTLTSTQVASGTNFHRSLLARSTHGTNSGTPSQAASTEQADPFQSKP